MQRASCARLAGPRGHPQSAADYQFAPQQRSTNQPGAEHYLVTVGADMTIEKAMQFIKGGFSYRLKKECGYLGEVWQRGFSEVRVANRPSFLKHRDYIAANPIRAGLVDSPEKYPYCFAYLASRKGQGLKPRDPSLSCGTAEAVP